jgi:tripartite-type tricarboxylate transporter receptor subunit TctC
MRKLMCGLSILFAGISCAHAQAYPTKAVRVIVPTAPGGPSDLNGRGVAAVFAEGLGQPFVVENRPGADSMIGNEACVRSAPDGYTLCTSDAGGFSLNPAVRLKMAYDPLRDLAPIVHTGFIVSAFVVHPSVPAGSLKELLALAKAKPGSVSFATSGLTSQPSIMVEWLKNTQGIVFLAVPYKVQTQGVTAVVAGEAQATTFVANQSAQFAKAGKLKVLAHNGTGRSRYVPDAPTYKDSGLDFGMRTWLGYFAPAATPPEIVRRLNAEAVRGLFKNPAAAEKFQALTGLEWEAPAGQPPEAFAAYLKADREYYAKVIAAAGIKPE